MGTAGKGKFKVGDRVRLVDHGYAGPISSGVITGRDKQGKRWRVDTNTGEDLGFYDSQVECIGPPAIVAVIENGTPRPNVLPRIHDTEASATTEAERLAKLNPGQTFGVFVQTTARVADVTVRVV